MSLKTDIEALNDKQIGLINSKNKRVICNKDFGVIFYSEEIAANSVHAQIEALNTVEFDALNASLPSSRKLSGRPC
tara:strand:- start:308 stop:535 length:228 start_codon:yes stop_codon:yes gene_type:complete